MNKIKHWREKRNLTQKELAKKMKINQHHISRWENGTFSPSIKSLIKLSKVLKVKITELIE